MRTPLRVSAGCAPVHGSSHTYGQMPARYPSRTDLAKCPTARRNCNVTVDRPPLPNQAAPGRGPRPRRSAVPRPPPGGQGSTPCQPTRGVTGRARAPCRGPTDCSIDGGSPAAVRALARQSQPAHPDGTPRCRDPHVPPPLTPRRARDSRPARSTTCPSTSRAPLAPLGSRPRIPRRTHQRQASSPTALRYPHGNASPPLCVAALRLTAHSCTKGCLLCYFALSCLRPSSRS